ncbi:hypothetical protein [Aminipila sp.]|uniref:hypothetical protein n=1 Tax=Aminipila sp. TaxID=2060095 RepID=UPI0028A06B3C|nr:hypothetical protein [Aminipila sp.]
MNTICWLGSEIGAKIGRKKDDLCPFIIGGNTDDMAIHIFSSKRHHCPFLDS